ncbi:MAG: pentapeptide repeat-containing protein [Cyanobacteria bacterium]|nr:pentapeptide repeat-containing protein [Cyanobacteriota bacterium]
MIIGKTKWLIATEYDEMRKQAEQSETELDFFNYRFSGDFSNCNFASTVIRTSFLQHVVFRRAWFSSATVTKCMIRKTDFDDSIFEAANLINQDFCSATMRRVDFSNANLKDVDLSGVPLNGSDFSKATLDNVDVRKADLRGTNFKTAIFKKVNFKGALFDASTQFPEDFKDLDKLSWMGEGLDPRYKSQLEVPPGLTLDFDAFMHSLCKTITPRRLKIVDEMIALKDFEVLAQIQDDTVFGIIKHSAKFDSKNNLLFACALDKSGNHSCFMDDLNRCNMISTGLCKHISLVLITLVKEGQLDPTTADLWMRTASLQKAGQNRKLIKSALKRFEDGQFQWLGSDFTNLFDWRHNETIPEDFYSV